MIINRFANIAHTIDGNREVGEMGKGHLVHTFFHPKEKNPLKSAIKETEKVYFFAFLGKFVKESAQLLLLLTTKQLTIIGKDYPR